MVAEHAVAVALAEGRRAFYTTPIKALSNQKFNDLVQLHGADNVGLLTGDNAIRPDAPVVVMTTEVLRNMVYARAAALDGLAWVILDEVHFLQDAYRGPVWEEVLVHAPGHVRFVCLSATVSNAEELAAWITEARGPTETVLETERPVELVNHYLVADRGIGDLVQVQTLVGGRPNPEGDRFDPPAVGRPRHGKGRERVRQRWATPRRSALVEHLARSDLLPTICFVFSRKGCDDAARAVVGDGFRLTSSTERQRIKAIVGHHLRHLDRADRTVLDYDEWRARLEAGVASHHAGLVPPFKEAVEACFVEGLVKVVFATETLALGINMPARSVVIESLSKFTGETHEDLTPSQYTQLTGRAGRRGLDPVGHALVLWSPWTTFDKVAALAASREFVLRSAFRPTPNMAVNLIRRHDRDQAHELLGRSFAQFQADRSLGRLAHRRARRVELLAAAEAAAHCEIGDIDEYRRLRRAEREARRSARLSQESVIETAVEELSPGDIFRLGGRRLAVLSSSYRKGSIRLRAIDDEANALVLDVEDFDTVPQRAGAINLPEPYDPQDRIFQRKAANALRKARLRSARTQGDEHVGPPPRRPADASSFRSLPVAGCPDLEKHLSAAAERDRLRGQVADLDQRLERKGSSLIRQFDQVVSLLGRWGFVDGWKLTERGELLARIFHETDLLTAAVVADGILDGLDPASLAGLVSTLTYEHRSKEAPPPPWFPSADVKERATRIDKLARRLQRDELALELPPTRLPDPTFLALAQAWAAGEPLDVVLGDEDLSGGDFVRNIKTLIDLVRQIAEVAPDVDTRASARRAADGLFRGVVAASSEVGA